MSKVFQHAARQRAFEAELIALRKLFPDARESFVRHSAWSKARQVKIEPKLRKSRAVVSVAQTYRAPTRAERQEAHRNKMGWKDGLRECRLGHVSTRVPANLSVNHPDFGLTPTEHARRKAERNA